MEVVDIKTQKLSTLLCDHLKCQYCGYVDRDHERIRVGSLCEICKKPSPGGLCYYGNQVYGMIDLMQETFHSRVILEFDRRPFNLHTSPHYISVVLHFCTLKEILMEKYLEAFLFAKDNSANEIEEILEKNVSFEKRRTKLFPNLFGTSWESAIEIISKECDYSSINEFMKSISKIRNMFIHEGRSGKVTPQLARDCVNKTWGMVNLFVGLHNEYVHPVEYANIEKNEKLILKQRNARRITIDSI